MKGGGTTEDRIQKRRNLKKWIDEVKNRRKEADERRKLLETSQNKINDFDMPNARNIIVRPEKWKKRKFNIFDDLMYYDLFERLSYTKYNELIETDNEINTIISSLLETYNDIEFSFMYDDVGLKRSEFNESTVDSTQSFPMKTGQSYVYNNNKRLKQTNPPYIETYGGTVDKQDQQQISFKLFNDFFHDFNPARGGRNPLAVQNRKYYLEVFGSLWEKSGMSLISEYHVDEDTYMRKVLEEMEPEYYEEFVIGSYDNLKLLNSSADADKHPVTKAIDEYRVNKLENEKKKLIVIEDTNLTESLKNPAKLFSQNTYTNILDPITKIKTDDGYTSKHDKLVYDSFANKYYDNNEKEIKQNYQNKIDEIVRNFFNSVKHPTTWAIKEFSIPFKFFKPIEDDSDQSVKKYYHFKVKIQFEEKPEEVLEFNIYGGMFTVERINELIFWATSSDPNKMEKTIMKKINDTGNLSEKNLKLWMAIKKFYIKIKEKLNNNQTNAIVFIQMMKALGDHAQIYEFNILSNKFEGGNKNLIFSSMDRIIVAEAFRLKCPTFLPFGSLKAKFPDNFINTDLKLELEKSQQKILYFNPHNLGDSINISKLLFESNIIREDIQIIYDKGNNNFFKNTIPLDKEIVKNELIQSLVPINENILAELNVRIINEQLDEINKDKINKILKLLILFNRVKSNLNNRLNNFENKDDVFIEKLKTYHTSITTIQRTYDTNVENARRSVSRGRVNVNKIQSTINRFEEVLKKLLRYYRLLTENQINIDIYSFRGCQQIFETQEVCESIYYKDFENIIINNVRTNPVYSKTFDYQMKLQKSISYIERETVKKIEQLQSQISPNT